MKNGFQFWIGVVLALVRIVVAVYLISTRPLTPTTPPRAASETELKQS